MVRQVVFPGKVVRFELAPATPFTKYICFEVDEHINFDDWACFVGKQVKIIIEEIKNERD